MYLSRVNAHVRDASIRFYASYEGKSHVYIIDGVKTPPMSVTTIVKKQFEEFDADTVIEKYYKGWQRKPESKYYGLTKQQIKDMWERNRVDSSGLGTEMHDCIEKYLNGELSNPPDTIEFKYFMNFWKDIQSSKPDYRIYRTEWIVYNDKKTIAGSIDAVLETGNGELVILDWKRSKEIKTEGFNGKMGKGWLSHMPDCNYSHYTLQLNCYKYLLESYYNKVVRGMYLVVLHPDNDNYILVKVETIPGIKKGGLEDL